MIFSIQHTTEYLFDNDVFLEPHILRFRPRYGAYGHTTDYRIDIVPEPKGSSFNEEATGSYAQLCWFEGSHRSLRIQSNVSYESVEHDPFSFLIYPLENMSLPIIYDTDTLMLLSPCLNRTGLSDGLILFVNDLVKKSHNNTLQFLLDLTISISRAHTLVIRDVGPPLSPEKTFSSGEGSCRDLAWLQINLLRNIGIAARFVSGYFYLEATNPKWELHAWVEVYLPGAGWLAYDPSHGLACTNMHIPVATGALPQLTMPVTGTFRGDAKVKLTTDIDITVH